MKIIVKKHLAIIFTIIAVLILIIIKFIFSTEKIQYTTDIVKTGSIKQVVNATGVIGAIQLVSVGAQVSGQIEKLHISLGQVVKKRRFCRNYGPIWLGQVNI